MKERWWTAPAVAADGRTVIVTGRDYLDSIREGGKYHFLIRVSWKYNALPNGMPEDGDAQLMEQATDALQAAFKKDKIAYMTGIYTGAGERDWVFYTKNLAIFGTVFNKALAELDQMPLEIEALDDPEWEEYTEMRENSYIPENEEE
jgi:hypothetical protein